MTTPPDDFGTPTRDGEIQRLAATWAPTRRSRWWTSTSRRLKSHTLEVYEGDHGNRVPQQFETKVPFFSKLPAAR
jgi:hypothetical protein